MKEYKVISQYTPIELGKTVTEELRDGWQLVGAVTVTSFQNVAGFNQLIYSQALAR